MENLTRICPRCGRKINNKLLNVSGGCAICDWLSRYSDRIDNDLFNIDDSLIVVEKFLSREWKYINDIVEFFSDKYSTEQCIDLIEHLKIANRPIRIKVPCAACGSDVEIRLSKYRNNKYILCNRKCYSDFRKTLTGDKNPGYKRIKVSCSNCGKEIEIIPYNMNRLNSFGESNNFCSRNCYNQFRSKYYSGDKHPMYQHEYSDEQLNHLRRALIRNMSYTERLNSKIQLVINDVLDNNHINYKREFVFDYYSVDNYLEDYNLIIEVMGDYWHGNPEKYNLYGYKLNHIQAKTILKDKQKKSYIFNNYNVPILYLWEHDIEKHLHLCEELVKQFIIKNGKLRDYNSFNYELRDGVPLLKPESQILTPYQSMHSSQYASLVN